ncbi:MAG TPA: hypothetical protein ENF28_03810 [Proteobacteria bacterium]|nr:MAG: hypothetical protein DRG80_02565 [Deltaproteobacteria bacterium]HDJ28354.1 hypothetical protein [Pseudomonadota bacterium]
MTEKQAEIPKNFWKCSACGYTIQAVEPPEECPSCHKKCEFSDVTCYAPECNFTGVDPRLG